MRVNTPEAYHILLQAQIKWFKS